MTELKYRDRKSAVLGRPSLPCLKKRHAVNLTAGCHAGCVYCYTRGYSSAPASGTVAFYRGSYERLLRELPRKKVMPAEVYFSTSCEPFAPFEEVIRELYNVMRLLLMNGVRLSISTKARPPGKFIELFEKHRSLVRVDMGVNTLDDGARRRIEPAAAPVKERLAGLSELLRAGVDARVRMDPLIPGVNDGADGIEKLIGRLARLGVREIVPSYVFLRPANRNAVLGMARKMGSPIHEFFTGKIDGYCGGGGVNTVDPAYRARAYEMIRETAAARGITVRLCSCKNPDITDELCTPSSREEGSIPDQLGLFESSWLDI